MSLAKTDLEASSGDERRLSSPSAPDSTKEEAAAAVDGPQDEDDFPDGGLRAWLVVAGGASIFFCCLGFGNSFGTFEAYYLAHQLRGQSPDNIAWIGSVAAFLPFASGVLGGPLFDRYGAAVRYSFLSFPSLFSSSVIIALLTDTNRSSARVLFSTSLP